jgi:Flp pilus assembly protein TadG
MSQRVSRSESPSFRSNESGNVTIIFGFALVPLLLLLGGVADYARATRARGALQQAIDSATLAATSNMTRANILMQTELQKSIITGVSATFTKNADGSVTGTATGSVASTILQLANVKSFPIGATSTASSPISTPSSVEFTLTGAYGWYWKEVSLYVHTIGATSDTLLASYTYQPVDLSYGGSRGDGTVTAQFQNGNTMAPGPVTTPVSLGSNYDNAYMTMTVYSDGCAPGYAPQTAQASSTTNYTCVASGTSVTTGTGKHKTTTTYTKTATPVVYSTKSATTSHNLFVNGVDLPLNVTPTIFSVLPCGPTPGTAATVTHAWEDTPYNASVGNAAGTWSQQDIFFSISNVCAVNVNYAGGSRLIK